MEIQSYLSERRRQIDAALEKYCLAADGPFSRHIEAMRYSLFVGGKRIRPILCLAAGETIDNSKAVAENLLPVACALECIHTYSLIHDDLPAMDNDELRRGQPTNHMLYGEAGAILAGDSLLTWAFELLTDPTLSKIDANRRLTIAHCVARSAGPQGMVGGQSLDIASEHADISFETLQTIHRSKTGALITCAVEVGAIGAGASREQLVAMIHYGTQIGLAFQIVDDLLNVTSSTEQLGKAAGSDAAHGKATYPAFFGITETRARAAEAISRAKEALTGFDAKADPLRELADFISSRTS